MQEQELMHQAQKHPGQENRENGFRNWLSGICWMMQRVGKGILEDPNLGAVASVH